LGRKEGKKNVIKRMVSQMSKILLKNSRVWHFSLCHFDLCRCRGYRDFTLRQSLIYGHTIDIYTSRLITAKVVLQQVGHLAIDIREYMDCTLARPACLVLVE
jgi:hypothetical protein